MKICIDASYLNIEYAIYRPKKNKILGEQANLYTTDTVVHLYICITQKNILFFLGL
jgi:hypothetical protein